MLMALAAPIKFGEMRNVFKCKYVHSAQKKKKRESNAFMKGEECVKEVILETVLLASGPGSPLRAWHKSSEV